MIPSPNLSPDAMPWARSITELVEELVRANRQIASDGRNNNQQLTTSINTLTEQQRIGLGNLYNKAEVDAKDTSVYNSAVNLINTKANISHTHDQSAISGTWDKSVNTGGFVAAQDVYARSLATNITAARVSLWGRTSDGYIATASSSERYKANIRPADIDPKAVLSIEPIYYNSATDVEEHDRRAELPTDDPEYTPNMHMATNIGFSAEDLHAAGLWEFVVYLRNPDDSLVLDDLGKPIPDGIHYINWGIALQSVVRSQQAEIDNLKERLDNLEQQ